MGQSTRRKLGANISNSCRPADCQFYAAPPGLLPGEPRNPKCKVVAVAAFDAPRNRTEIMTTIRAFAAAVVEFIGNEVR